MFAFDGGYHSVQLTVELAGTGVQTAVRVRDDRTRFARPSPRPAGGGRPRRHGVKVACADPQRFLADFEFTARVELNQAFARNPTVPGTKSEDTILAGNDRPETLTTDPCWPTKIVAGLPRPLILEREVSSTPYRCAGCTYRVVNPSGLVTRAGRRGRPTVSSHAGGGAQQLLLRAPPAAVEGHHQRIARGQVGQPPEMTVVIGQLQVGQRLAGYQVGVHTA